AMSSSMSEVAVSIAPKASLDQRNPETLALTIGVPQCSRSRASFATRELVLGPNPESVRACELLALTKRSEGESHTGNVSDASGAPRERVLGPTPEAGGACELLGLPKRAEAYSPRAIVPDPPSLMTPGSSRSAKRSTKAMTVRWDPTNSAMTSSFSPFCSEAT